MQFYEVIIDAVTCVVYEMGTFYFVKGIYSGYTSYLVCDGTAPDTAFLHNEMVSMDMK